MTEEEQNGRYRVTIQFMYIRESSYWAYSIVDKETSTLGYPTKVWYDTTWTRWGAAFAAKRALRKLRKGKTQHKPTLYTYSTD